MFLENFITQLRKNHIFIGVDQKSNFEKSLDIPK